MGGRLMKYYELVDEKLGHKGRQQLASLTRMPPSVAAHIPDADELVETFHEATKTVIGASPPRF
jgi:hypothetical protein